MSTPSVPIEGRVARVLDSRTLVINRGHEHGVTPGMAFEVLDPTGTNILDPDTHEEIGSVLRPKVQVRVTDVQPRLAVAVTFHKRRINVGGSGPDLGWLMTATPRRYVTRRESFKTEEAAWEQIDEAESFIKTGDPVRQVFEPIEDEADQGEAQTGIGSNK